MYLLLTTQRRQDPYWVYRTTFKVIGQDSLYLSKNSIFLQKLFKFECQIDLDGEGQGALVFKFLLDL